MKRPAMTSHLATETIQAAFDKANIQDMRNAEDIQKFSIRAGYRASDSIAAGIRFGFMEGKRNGNKRAEDAHMRLHEYMGVQDKSAPPAQRIRNAATWIDDPAVLLELAALLTGRAAALNAGKAVIRNPDLPQEAPEPDSSEDDLRVPDIP